jgi:tetratricopeptide (TPR) repeat protein
MPAAYFRRLSISFLGLLISACATFDGQDSKAPYYDQAFDDKNRAPASVSFPPSVISDQVIDPFHMRTQADYNYALGETYSNEGQSQKAVEAFKLTLVYDPNSVQVRLRLAAEHIKLGQINQALQKTEESVKLDSKNVEARLLMAGLYSSLKTYDKAISQYEWVISHHPNHQEATLYLAAVYSETKQPEKAIKLFETLLKNAPPMNGDTLFDQKDPVLR